MSRISVLVLFTGLLAPPWCHAEWARVLDTGCSIDLPYVPDPLMRDSLLNWSGQCEYGLATGQGILTASYGTRIEGEFRKGRPFNASGRFMRANENWVQEMVSVVYKRGKPSFKALVEMPNRTRIDMAPILGSWDWKNLDGKCDETHVYRRRGASNIRRKESASLLIVELFTVDGSPGWMEVLTTAFSEKRSPDCEWPRRDAMPETSSAYLRLDGDGKLWRCSAPDQATCNAVATRTPVDPSERNLITSAAGRSSGGINTSVLPRHYGGSERRPIEETFERNKGTLYALYGRALRDNPKLAGKVVFEVDIDVAGVATAVRIQSSELNHPELEKKLVARIQLIQFGPRAVPETFVKSIDFVPLE